MSDTGIHGKTRGGKPRATALAGRAPVRSLRRSEPVKEFVEPVVRPGWREAIERTVQGLNYELVDVERAPRGLLRIYIDRIAGQVYGDSEGEFITVEDCEQVTRQLQYSLEVDGVDYARLEVSSPGLDRPLRRATDYERFSGHEVSLTLKLPFKGRKAYKGTLQPAEGGWSLVFSDGKTEQVLAFSLDEVREARLVPVVDFKGRARQAGPHAADGPVPGELRRTDKSGDLNR